MPVDNGNFNLLGIQIEEVIEFVDLNDDHVFEPVFSDGTPVRTAVVLFDNHA